MGATEKRLRRYSFKLYPTQEQREEMQRQCHMVGDLWNALLERCETNYRLWLAGRRVDTTDWPEKGRAIAERLWCEGSAPKSHLSRYDLSSEWSWLRAECPEWAALSTWTGHRVIEALDNAFQAFFRRARQGAGAQSGYPRFKPRRFQNWLPHRAASGFSMSQIRRDDVMRRIDWAMTLKGVPGIVRAKGRFPAAPIAFKHADIRLHGDVWWLSIAVEMPARMVRGDLDRVVRFDLLDCFATVDGHDMSAWAVGLGDRHGDEIAALQQRMAEVQKFGDQWQELRRQLSRLQAKGARQRREALQDWTTQIVRSSASLTVIRPPSIKEVTASGRGDERAWGAAVKTKADFNRHVLGQAPGMAIQMLTYKAAEAGIEYREIAAEDALKEGNALVAATKENRRLKRATNRRKAA